MAKQTALAPVAHIPQPAAAAPVETLGQYVNGMARVGKSTPAPSDHRQLNGHHVDEYNKSLIIDVTKEDGWRAIDYRVSMPGNRLLAKAVTISFQHGDVASFGANGITEMSLLTILIDRMASRDGFLSDDEEAALSYLRDAHGELVTHASNT